MADDAWSTIENHQGGSLFASIPDLLQHAIDRLSPPFFFFSSDSWYTCTEAQLAQ